ncbi:hypothetical protein [Cellulomonas sp. NPDC089187]|uniref:hypothetical protein n=1 Tax=Cellulomonas sp. NPDC089187 TaxID=3154970 RepID=UPI0034423245
MRRLLTTLALGGALLFTGAPLAVAALPTVNDPDGSIEVGVTIPDLGDPEIDVTNGQLRWSVNAESGAGAFFGGCNFLMAGRPGSDGNAGSARIWSEADGLYRAVDGDVRVDRPIADGSRVTADWATRCTDRDGVTVTTGNNRVTEQQVVIDGGVGSVDPEAGTAQIRWSGTFSVVFYGGMSYWWASDPVLTVQANGTARLTATAGGYGTSMTDTTQWNRLPDTTVTLAELTGVQLVDQGFARLPEYRGVTVNAPASAVAQVREGADWGSFPQSLVDFQGLTGQAAYWYSTGGASDARKPAGTLYVSYDAASALVPAEERPEATDVAAGGGGTSSGSAGSSGAGGAPVAAALAGTPPLTIPAVTTQTVTQARDGLIPDVAASPAGQAVVWGAAGLMLAGSGTIFGFRKGWLVLPWR